MGRIVHFEITADDVPRARRFYEIFDWEITDAGMPGADYWLAKTGDGGMGIDGAIMPRAYNAQPSIVWIGVGDLDATIARVVAAGGSLVGERQTVPGVGDTIYAKDTEGNTFGIIQPLPRI
ncbi:MAG: VOC family protein [Candidatus Dormibacteria bacterium]|jgi:predicted enzyme related to lactoylglutathione lyase